MQAIRARTANVIASFSLSSAQRCLLRKAVLKSQSPPSLAPPVPTSTTKDANELAHDLDVLESSILALAQQKDAPTESTKTGEGKPSKFIPRAHEAIYIAGSQIWRSALLIWPTRSLLLVTFRSWMVCYTVVNTPRLSSSVVTWNFCPKSPSRFVPRLFPNLTTSFVAWSRVERPLTTIIPLSTICKPTTSIPKQQKHLTFGRFKLQIRATFKNGGIRSVANRYLDHLWREHFRVSRDAFEHICGLVGPELVRQNTILRQAISVEERFAVALWRLATGNSYRTVRLTFAIGRCTDMNVKDEFYTALLRRANDFIKFTKTKAETRQSVQEFQGISRFPQVEERPKKA